VDGRGNETEIGLKQKEGDVVPQKPKCASKMIHNPLSENGLKRGKNKGG